MLPYGKQSISNSDVEAVVRTLLSENLTQGAKVPEFEGTISTYCGCHYSVAVNSATSGLHVACLALGLRPGDELWTSPISFVASSNCALYCGAKVDFVDIDPLTYNMSIECLEKKLKKAKEANKVPKIVVPVHLCGQSCDMERMASLKREYGFKIIEDASHAIGGSYHGRPIGNCQFSDITVFSFHPVKIITTGEGGMAVTNDESLVQKMRRFRSHGITRDPLEMTSVPDGSWYYQQIELGFNYRMTDIQAALGISQMFRLDSFVRRRQEIAQKYATLLHGLPVILPTQDPKASSAYHLYPILILDLESKGREAVFESLRKQDIGVNVHYIPIHLQPYYRKMGFAPGDFPEAENYYRRAISIPIYPDLQDADLKKVTECLKIALG
jgi:UDP-4-amino-4,6-dideoxy-N-acetyl-beta-L-altrosamine transaminase